MSYISGPILHDEDCFFLSAASVEAAVNEEVGTDVNNILEQWEDLTCASFFSGLVFWLLLTESGTFLKCKSLHCALDTV